VTNSISISIACNNVIVCECVGNNRLADRYNSAIYSIGQFTSLYYNYHLSFIIHYTHSSALFYSHSTIISPSSTGHQYLPTNNHTRQNIK
jgi:hypothetical protein